MNKTAQKRKKPELSAKQLKTISALLQSASLDEAARTAHVSRTSIYAWLRQKNFKEILERKRAVLFNEGMNLLRASSAKAAQVLIDLLDDKDVNQRRLSAKDILSFVVKIIETQSLEERIQRIEEVLELTGSRHEA